MSLADNIKLKFPFAPCDNVSPEASSNVYTVVAKNTKTIVNVSPAANSTLNVTIDSELMDGSTLKVVSLGQGGETLTFGSGINAPVITNASGKTKCQSFTYNAETGIFEADGAVVQID